MFQSRARRSAFLGCLFVLAAAASGCSSDEDAAAKATVDPTLAAMGKDIFRFDTFGDETFWTDTLRMHEVIADGGRSHDRAVRRPQGRRRRASGRGRARASRTAPSSLNSPATTVALLKLTRSSASRARSRRRRQGHADARRHHLRALPLDRRQLVRAGHRQAARRLAEPRSESGRDHRAVAGADADAEGGLQLVGPGQVRPALQPRRQERPAGHSARVRPARHQQHHRHRRRRRIAYWNRYVGGHPDGRPRHRSSEPRTGVNVTNGTDDQVTPQAAGAAGVPAEHRRRRRRRPAASTPPPPRAARWCSTGAGKCATCHSGSEFTDANSKLHDPSEVVSEPEPNGAPSYASRSATKKYRTAPLQGLWQHAPYFHNGSAATLEVVVDTYDTKKSLGLTADQKSDLVQYLKSL